MGTYLTKYLSPPLVIGDLCIHKMYIKTIHYLQYENSNILTITIKLQNNNEKIIYMYYSADKDLQNTINKIKEYQTTSYFESIVYFFMNFANF